MIKHTLPETTPSHPSPNAASRSSNAAPPPSAESRVPPADPSNPSLLLTELLDPTLSPLDLCDHHNLTLEQLEAWMNSPRVTAALDAHTRIENRRRQLIAERAQTQALAALEQLTQQTPDHVLTAQQQLRCNETRRKAAAQLLRKPHPSIKNPTQTIAPIGARKPFGSGSEGDTLKPHAPTRPNGIERECPAASAEPDAATCTTTNEENPMHKPIAVIAALAAPLAPALADDLFPVVRASIHDEPRDGMGDSFNNAPFEGLLRVQSHRADRAVAEFDLSDFAGGTVLSATIHGQIFNNNAGGDFPRVFEFLVYEANGQADLSDYQIDAALIGEASWPAPSPPLEFSFDATQQIQDVLDSGTDFAGLRVQGISDNLFPSILGDALTLTIEATPACPADLDGDGDADADDFFAYLDLFVLCDPNGECDADLDGDNDADADDFFAYLDLFVQGCP